MSAQALTTQSAQHGHAEQAIMQTKLQLTRYQVGKALTPPI